MKYVELLLPNCFIETDFSLGTTQNKISDFGQEELLDGNVI